MPNRSGRVLIRRVFNDKIVQLVIVMLAVQIEPNKSTSLGAPTALFKSVDLY